VAERVLAERAKPEEKKWQFTYATILVGSAFNINMEYFGSFQP
jgi:hypothetical protein